jgi:hypothetical protein
MAPVAWATPISSSTSAFWPELTGIDVGAVLIAGLVPHSTGGLPDFCCFMLFVVASYVFAVPISIFFIAA